MSVISAYLAVAGLTDVGYRFYTSAEAAVAGRVTAGIIDAGDGWYSADATIPGTGASVRWDSSANTEAKAREYLGPESVDPWTLPVPGSYALGSAGKVVGDNLDAKVSTRSTYAGADTAGTTTLLSRIASVLTITSGKVDINDKTGFSLTAAYDPAKQVSSAPGDAMTLTSAERLAIADAFLKRDWVQVSGEAGESVLNALRSIRNKWTLDLAGTLTVYREDGSTVAWQRVVTTDQNALPITGMT